MTANEYQKKASETALYQKGPIKNSTVDGDIGVVYTLLGLAGEVGEVCNKYKKVIRGDKIENFKKAITHELGGVVWYLAETCTRIGITLEEVMEENLKQLASRKARGVIKGSGDNR